MTNQNSRLPGAVIGNSRMLATLSPGGNLVRLFWPSIDFPQNIGQNLAGVILQRSCNSARLVWLHDSSWHHEQYYLENTNILITKHFSRELGLEIIQEDFVHPYSDILVRRFCIKNINGSNQACFFAYYSHMTVNDMTRYNTAHYLNNLGAFLHYFKDIYFIIGCDTEPGSYQCGKPGGKDDPMLLLHRGIPAGKTYTNGISAAAGIWKLGILSTGDLKKITLFIAAGSSLKCAEKKFARCREIGFQKLHSETYQFWQSFLSNRRSIAIPVTATIDKLYRRSLLLLKLLSDETSGAFIAAPEFDPCFEHSGGYGYCWPRDSVFIAWALTLAGYKDLAEKFYFFGARTLRDDGLWGQRYHTSGLLAPSWGDQLDETGIMLWGIRQHYILTRNRNFLAKMWDTVKKAALGLIHQIDLDYLPAPCMDLWEDLKGRGTYTIGATIAGLRAASAIAMELNSKDGPCEEAEYWKITASKMETALDKFLWNKKRAYFMRSLVNGMPDPTVDSATLGLIFPFGILKPQSERAKLVVNTVERTLLCGKNGGIMRYQGDEYIGGNPWILTTLWLSICFHLIGERQKAVHYFHWAVKHRSHLDLLAEQVDKFSGRPAWALPLAWSHAMFILAVFFLEDPR